MKIYTKTGDDGTTGLYGGQRVAKDSVRVEAIGALDELNAHLGMAVAACRHGEMKAQLLKLQARIFEAGADLATPRSGNKATAKVTRIGGGQIAEEERMIDAAWEKCEPMRSFILPGGSELSARLHVARTVSRRAERLAVALSRGEDLGPDLVIYLNRMSDLLFALARWANVLEGVGDVPWVADGN
jgi:cob(I)alamin adenosyltransferase